jgi:hypothetical protein
MALAKQTSTRTTAIPWLFLLAFPRAYIAFCQHGRAQSLCSIPDPCTSTCISTTSVRAKPSEEKPFTEVSKKGLSRLMRHGGSSGIVPGVAPVRNCTEGKSLATQAELVTVIQTESEQLKQYLNALPQDAWTKPSACALWEIRDVVAHMRGGGAWLPGPHYPWTAVEIPLPRQVFQRHTSSQHSRGRNSVRMPALVLSACRQVIHPAPVPVYVHRRTQQAVGYCGGRRPSLHRPRCRCHPRPRDIFLRERPLS